MEKQKFNVIFASSRDDVIADISTNSLPWKKHYTEDLKYFKNITSFCNIQKNVIIMGKNTWLSLPNKTLINRIPIVISTSLAHDDRCIVVTSFEDALRSADKLNPSNIWIIGGLNVYISAFNHYRCGNIYHTIIPEYVLDDVSDTNLSSNKYLKLDIPFYKTITSFTKDNIIFNKNLLEGEFKYLRLLSKLINCGDFRNTRNAKTYSLFDESIEFDLTRDHFPILTTKRMFWKGIVEELLFFIRGNTNSKLLEDKGINIWKGNTSNDFLNKMELPYNEGDMGPMYGFNWRHYGAKYTNCDEDYTNKGIDQFKNIINLIKHDPTSRRIIMTDYNPSNVHQGVLYPCHSIVIQFYVRNRFLDIKMYQRSVDSFLGLPFNISSTALLLSIVAKLTNKIPAKVCLTLGDCHIYDSHIEQVVRQLKRLPYRFPSLNINNIKTLEDVENANVDNFELINYKYHKGIKANMIP